MNDQMKALFLAVFSFAVVSMASPSMAQSAAKNDCAAFPQVAWWGNMNHERVVRYVQRRHKGDWEGYVKKWEKQLSVMQGILERNSVAVIKKRGVKLEGPELAEYIKQIEDRVAVTRCLAAVEQLNSFSTAAGKEKKTTVKKTTVKAGSQDALFDKAK